MNFGGSILTANKEQPCYEGKEYTFDYREAGQVSYIYLVGVANANNAHLRFTYWAEYRVSYGGWLGIALASFIGLTLILIAIFYFVVDLTVKKALKDTTDRVKRIIKDANGDDSQELIINPTEKSSYNMFGTGGGL